MPFTCVQMNNLYHIFQHLCRSMNILDSLHAGVLGSDVLMTNNCLKLTLNLTSHTK